MLLLRHSSHSLGKATRLSAAVIALLFCAGQLGSYLHLATVRHERCAEHGELVDAPLQRVHANLFSAASKDLDKVSGERFSRSDSPVAAHHHEHCALAPNRRHEAALTSSLPSLALAAVTSSFVSKPIDTTPVRRSLYRLAPKNSPPV